MMLAMDGRPENRRAFARQKAEHRQSVLDPHWRTEGLMSDLAMVTHRNAQAGDEIERQE
jgi:hypothetical protein